MGICEINPGHTLLMSKEEIEQLYTYKYAICEITFEAKDKNKKEEFFANGFFCELNEKSIPFSKALFTNNQILDENKIKVHKKIEFDICGVNYMIEITKDRRVFTNAELDYTCIEILDKDNINNVKFFNIDKKFFENKNDSIKKEILILQYYHKNFCHGTGKISGLDNNIIKYSAHLNKHSSGFPLIKRYNINYHITNIHQQKYSYNSKIFI